MRHENSKFFPDKCEMCTHIKSINRPIKSCNDLQSLALKDSQHALLTTAPPITNYGEIWPHIQHKYTKF